MAMNLIRTQAGDGIFVNLIKDDRFKHDRISVNFILPLSRETATGYALLPFLMQRGYAGCSDFTAFARKLDELYGATVSGRVSDHHPCGRSLHPERRVIGRGVRPAAGRHRHPAGHREWPLRPRGCCHREELTGRYHCRRGQRQAQLCRDPLHRAAL